MSVEKAGETSAKPRGNWFDWWDVIAFVGLVWFMVGVYMLFGAGWAFAVGGFVVLVGGVYGASKEAVEEPGDPGSTDARWTSTRQSKAR